MILLDTHVVLWWLSAEQRLSERVRRELARADTVFVSPVSCWEVATLVRYGRIALDRDVYEWVADLFDRDRVEPVPVTPEVATGAGVLPREFSGDPADRILYATAREFVLPFLTRDTRIRDYARSAKDVRTLW